MTARLYGTIPCEYSLSTTSWTNFSAKTFHCTYTCKLELENLLKWLYFEGGRSPNEKCCVYLSNAFKDVMGFFLGWWGSGVVGGDMING